MFIDRADPFRTLFFSLNKANTFFTTQGPKPELRDAVTVCKRGRRVLIMLNCCLIFCKY